MIYIYYSMLARHAGAYLGVYIYIYIYADLMIEGGEHRLASLIVFFAALGCRNWRERLLYIYIYAGVVYHKTKKKKKKKRKRSEGKTKEKARAFLFWEYLTQALALADACSAK